MRPRNTIIILILTVMLVPGAAFGQQFGSDYCSSPPYVTRSNAPNLMVLMDNSQDMMDPAYPNAYDPTTLGTANEYVGYFKPEACYAYSSNMFVEQLKTVLATSGGANFGISFSASDTCPSSAPFRGNLLNWATMSKYDVVQQILVGGNATSKQPGKSFYTLKGIEGAWATRSFSGCTFTTNNGNLTVSEATAGACTLLDATPTPIAFRWPSWPSEIVAWLSGSFERFVTVLAHGWNGLLAAVSNAWENSRLFVQEAWGASCSLSVSTSSSLNGTVNVPYSITFSASGKSNATYTWTASAVPSWMSGPVLSNSGQGNRVNDVATWSGTPPAAGSFPITVTSAVSGCTSGSLAETISITPAALLIITTGLPGGQVGSPYSFAMQGQGGTTPWTWSATGLPAGLSIDPSTGVIAGTPTASGSFAVTVKLADSGTPQQTASKNYTLTIGASSLAIVTTALPNGMVGSAYTFTMQGAGGTPPYTWSAAGLPGGLFMSPAGLISGVPSGPVGTFTVTVSLTDSLPATVTKQFNITITPASVPLAITSTCPQPDAVKGQPYFFTMTGTGGTPPYTWSITAGSLPPGITLNSSTGVISGTAPNQTGTFTFTITLTDSTSASVSDSCTLNVVKSLGARSQQFNIWVQLPEEPLVDVNGNNIFDPSVPGESFTDLNGNGVWDGKQGIFQQFWDQIHPRARWGLTTFGQQGSTTLVDINACIPASPAASFFTAIQNATPSNTSPLAAGLYGDINYYAFNGTGYKGCNNSNPIDSVTCRKNFVLVLSSGSNVSSVIDAAGNKSGPFASGTAGCTNSADLVQNACVGFNSSTATDSIPKVYTYIVNTMGAANNTTLQQAAAAGGGKYYDATNFSSLRSQLIQAIQDILAQAASGTAVSVLTTSSRGVGSVVQAYFLPSLQIGTRTVYWTGYMQNLWVDPQDNLREDTIHDFQLDLGQDDVIKLFFNQTTNQTEAGLFTTLEDGTGGSLAACTAAATEPFSAVKSLWEAGETLALTPPSMRTIFTSENVIRGGATTNTFSLNSFSWPLSDPAMTAALNPDSTYTADKIVGYVRGECRETGMSGDTACGSVVDPNFRDRRVILNSTNGNVWKLGDIISSTPKVLGNTPLNTYHIDYGDASYFAYISSPAYKQRSSVAFVGANDGMLHAFTVGFLKDTGLTGFIKALFQNSATDTGTNQLGDEMWAYIPFNAFPYLKYLADPAYCHIYFNDLSVRLVDVSTGGNPGDARPPDGSSWKTVLVGGMRFGGSCAGGVPNGPPISSTTGKPLNVGFSAYYAIDITNPSQPVPLWEFSDPDLGYATSFPTVLRTGPINQNGNWYVTFGSGSTVLPRSGTDIGRSTTGYLYILDLMKGTRLQKISLTDNAIVGDILAVDANKDYNTDKIYFGTAIFNTASLSWNGKLMSVSIPADQDIASWSPPAPVALFSGAYPFTAAPDATKDAVGNVWVYAGSGKYYSDVDETDTSQEIFFGLIDNNTTVSEGSTTPASCPTTCPSGSLCDVTNCTTQGTVGATIQSCQYNAATNSFGFQPVVTTVSSSGSQPKSTVGWKIYFDDAERIISRPLAVGGLVDFLTYLPSGDPCKYGGDSFLFSVDFTTGLAPTTIAIRAPNATSGTSGAVTVNRGVRLGPGAPPTGEAIILAPQKDTAGLQDKLKKKIQVATGVIVEAEDKPLISTGPKIMHWLKK